MNFYSVIPLHDLIDIFIKTSLLVISGSPKAEAESPSQAAVLDQVNGNDASENSVIYPYERLKVNSSDPVTDIDVTKREVVILFSSKPSPYFVSAHHLTIKLAATILIHFREILAILRMPFLKICFSMMIPN